MISGPTFGMQWIDDGERARQRIRPGTVRRVLPYFTRHRWTLVLLFFWSSTRARSPNAAPMRNCSQQAAPTPACTGPSSRRRRPPLHGRPASRQRAQVVALGPFPGHVMLRVPPGLRGFRGGPQPGPHRGQRRGAGPCPHGRAIPRRHRPDGQDRLRYRRPRMPRQPENRVRGQCLPALRTAVPCHRADTRQRRCHLTGL